jgi:hypothetical protein
MNCGVAGFILGPVVLVAGRVRQDLPYRHFVAAGQAGNILAHRVIELELSLLLQDENRSRGELLGDRADGVAHVRRGKLIGVDMGASVRMGKHELSALHYDDRCGGNAALLHHAGGNAVDPRLQRRIDGVDSLCAQARRGNACSQCNGEADSERGFQHGPQYSAAKGHRCHAIA